MKTVPFVIAAFVTIASSVRAEDERAEFSGVTAAGASTVNSTTAAPSLPAFALPAPVTSARIVGEVSDGTRAQPLAYRPQYSARQNDILESRVHEREGRTVTVHKIKPLALPPPPAPLPKSSSAPTATTAYKQQLAEYHATHPGAGALSIGATVYRTHASPPRTLVTYWPSRGGDPITFWSSANFALISGIHSFLATDGRTYNLFMAWSVTDTRRTAALSGGANQLPDIPYFPIGPATFTIVGTPPADPTVLIPIQSLHDLYNREYWRLRIAYQGREYSRHQHESEDEANPPQPRNIVLNYWTTDTPARAKKGGAK